MIAIISLSVVVAILGLVLYAHITANKDDRNFTAPNGLQYDHERQVVYTQKQIWKRMSGRARKPTLKEQLDMAVENEEYEIAAKIRDEMNKKK